MTLKQEFATLFVFIVLFVAGLTGMNALLLPHAVPKLTVLVLTSIIVGLLTLFVRHEFFYRRGFLR